MVTALIVTVMLIAIALALATKSRSGLATAAAAFMLTLGLGGGIVLATTDGYDSIRQAFQSAGGVYTTSQPTLSTAEHNELHLDSRAGLIVGGHVANDAADIGNPVKIGAIARNTWETAVTAADRVNLSADLYGRLRVIAGRESTTWSVVHTPSANTQATASKAAGASGVKHVCTGYAWSLSSGAGAPTPELITIAIRDGATGAGTIIWQETVSLPATAGSNAGRVVAGLYLVGTAATAMTIETDSAPGANVVASVSMMGEDISN